MSRVSMATRDELLAAVAGRYHSSTRAERIRILDEFAALTGYHRKHVMRLFRVGPSDRRSASRPQRRGFYDAGGGAPVGFWGGPGRLFGQRLQALLSKP